MTTSETTINETACETTCLHPEAVAQARSALPDHAVERASALLKAVADPTRLRMLSALARVELCVLHDLAQVTGISESAASHQLRLLRAHRLVSSRKVGRTVYYRLTDDHVTLLIASAVDREAAVRQELR